MPTMPEIKVVNRTPYALEVKGAYTGELLTVMVEVSKEPEPGTLEALRAQEARHEREMQAHLNQLEASGALEPATFPQELDALRRGAALAGVSLDSRGAEQLEARAQVGDVIQCNPRHCRWGAVLAIVQESREWGVIAHIKLAYLTTITEHMPPAGGIVPIRIDHAHYVRIGKALWQ